MKRGCGCLAVVPVLLFGLIFTVVGIVLLVGARNKRADFTSTNGMIVDLVASSNFDGDTTYAPVIEFKGPNDELFRFTSGFSRSPAPARGDTVGVRYNPDNPHDAAEDSVWVLFIFPIVALVVGLPFLVVGVFIGVRTLRAGVDPELRSKTRRAVVISGRASHPSVPPCAAQETGRRTPTPGVDPHSRPSTAQFHRVDPRGPDGDGNFEYRVVARDSNGEWHFSEWLSSDPTPALLTEGTDDVRLEWRDGEALVIDFPR